MQAEKYIFMCLYLLFIGYNIQFSTTGNNSYIKMLEIITDTVVSVQTNKKLVSNTISVREMKTYSKTSRHIELVSSLHYL